MIKDLVTINKNYKTLKKLVFALCFWAGLSHAQAQTVQPYREQLLLVESKLKSGDFAQALREMDNITDKYPQAADVYYAKALVLGQTGDYDGALINAKLAYQYDPSLAYANYVLDLYRAKQNIPDAIALLKEMRAAHPQVSSISRDLISLFSKQGNMDEVTAIYQDELKKGYGSDTLEVVMGEHYIAHEKYNDAVVLLRPLAGKSTLREVYSALGYAYLQDKKTKQALAVLAQGMKITNDPILNLDLAAAYKEDHKSKLAFDALLKAFESNKVEFMDKHRIMLNLLVPDVKDFSLDQVQLLANALVLVHPRYAESHVMKGEVLWRRGKMTEARAMFMTAVGLNPKHIDAWRMLINTDLGLNEVDQAIRHGEESLTVNPGNPMLLYFTGLAYMVKENFDRSRQFLELALDHSEEENSYLRSIIYSALGDLYHQLKMESASDVAYTESIALDSTNVTAMNNLAYYLSLRKHDLDKAAALSKKSNELEPNSPTFQDTYAWVLFQQEKYQEALVWIEKAVKASAVPSAVLLEHYGDILSKVGKQKEAIKQWEKALTLGVGIDKEKVQLKIKQKNYVE